MKSDRKQFFTKFNSFIKVHKRVVVCSLMAFSLLIVFVFALCFIPSCRGFWSADVAYRDKDKEVITSVNYKDSLRVEGSNTTDVQGDEDEHN